MSFMLPERDAVKVNDSTSRKLAASAEVEIEHTKSYPFEGSQSAALTDKWLKRLDTDAGGLVRQFRRAIGTQRIKIAILDTGIDVRNVAFAQSMSRGLIRVEDFVEPRGDGLDVHGHGTHCAALLCRIAPEAEIYVARVLMDPKRPPDVDTVTRALYRACSSGQGPDGVANWDVDIITLSLGYYAWCRSIDDALRHAYLRNKIVFAAASNAGISDGIPFPANLPTVVCIHAATALGEPSPFNPPPMPGKDLSILGENVESAWCCGPCGKVTKEQARVTMRKSGSSAATPIAAGVMALILELVHQKGPKQAMDPETLYRLRTPSSVYALLKEMSVQRRGYWNIVPWNLLKGTSDGIVVATVARWVVEKWER